MTTNEWIDELLEKLAYDYTDGAEYYATTEEIKADINKAKQAIQSKLQEEYKRGYNDAKAGYGTLEEYGTPGEFKLVDPREFTKQEEQ